MVWIKEVLFMSAKDIVLASISTIDSVMRCTVAWFAEKNDAYFLFLLGRE